MSDDREEIQTECERIVHRLSTMPVTRIDAAVIDAVRLSAQQIVDATTNPQRPPHAQVPAVQPSGLAAQIQVVVRDYLDTQTAASEDAAVAKVLIDLRRSLP